MRLANALWAAFVAMAIPGSFEAIRLLGERAQQSLYRSPLLQASRAVFGVLLGLAAVLLPAALWRNIEPLYAHYGIAVFLVALAPLLALILLYGRDSAD